MCFFIFLLLMVGLIFWAKQQKLIKRRGELQEKHEFIQNMVKSCVQEHLKTLVRRKRILITRDQYGTRNISGWDKELDYFWRSVLQSKITNALKTHESGEKIRIMKSIIIGTPSPTLNDEEVKLVAIAEVERLVVEASNQTDNQSASEVPTNPYEYEGYCRSLLEQFGWKAWQTPPSGDQGADVVAEKKNVVIVLQCKLWSQPIGNKAVQEVVAAKALHSATVAIVVSNQPYTDFAKQLAAANNVLLLHHDDLASLDSHLQL